MEGKQVRSEIGYLQWLEKVHASEGKQQGMQPLPTPLNQIYAENHTLPILKWTEMLNQT